MSEKQIRHKKCSIVFILLMIAFCMGSLSAQEKTTLRIYIGSMGQSDEAERFRMLLEKHIAKVGLTATQNPERADAILTGIIVVRVYQAKSSAQATVFLKDQVGRKIWEGNFQPRARFIFNGSRDPVEARAVDVAEALRNALDRQKK